jgi:uncharacterized protein with FMN-binding domain
MRRSIVKSVGAIALTAAGTAFVFGFRTSDNLLDTTAAAKVDTTTSGATTSATTTTSGSSGSSGSSATAAPSAATPATTAAYGDGTWTGQAVSEPWGPFQVQVVVSDGAIASVTVVESPSDNHSRRINNQAVPLLTESTIASQDSRVDTVSGATWTSESYATSLQSALDQAADAA